MTQVLTTPHVPIDRIEVIDGYNARTHFDPAKEAEMAANMAEVGMIEPLPVYVREDGRCELLAGERRFRAAQKAGLKEVPIAPQAARDRRIAFAENHHREDLDPIATARDLQALKEERELGTVKELAEAAGKKADWVGLHLRLLKLPEGVQEAIAAGRVSVKAERELREVAKASPAIAEWLCE
ncbi:MAG TPA: ParB/RepB/Spo0J family partition protein, partial [Solirubrobacterales bacterium]|nr:ParB/RepB/Spo0J family partition protein [Solirubrobacterales bacterium]